MSNTSQNTNKNNKSFGYDRNGKMYKRGKDMVSIMNGFVNEEKRSHVNKISTRIFKSVSKAMILVMACFVMLICVKTEVKADNTAKVLYSTTNTEIANEKVLLFVYDANSYSQDSIYTYENITYTINNTVASGNSVTNSGTPSGGPAWVGSSYKYYVTKVIITDSFKDVKPTSTWYWFNRLEYLATIQGMNNLDTSSVTSMCAMFEYCKKLKSLDLSSFNTSNTTDMMYMFRGCTELISLDLSSFNTSKVSSMDRMFYYCSSLQNIIVYDNWNVNKVSDSDKLFNNNTNLVGGAGTPYNESENTKKYAHIDGGTSNPGYFTTKYTVTLNTNGGTINSGNITTYVKGTGATLPTDVTKTGLSFSGWYDNAELSGDAVTEISITDEGNKTYYAKWTLPHTHIWNYVVGTGDKAGTIYAWCSESSSPCEYYCANVSDEHLTLILNASDTVYNGNPHAATITDGITSVTGASAVDISYYQTDMENAVSGGTSLGTTAPTNAGYYYASVTLGGATAVKAFKIDKADITISGITADNKEYNGNTAAILNYGSVSYGGMVGSDELTVSAVGTFIDANVGTGKAVTISSLALGGTSVNNYRLASSGQQETATASITAKEVGLSWSGTSLTYNGSEQCPTATATGLIEGDACTVTVTGGETNANAEGEYYTATAQSLPNGNYKLPDDNTQDYTIAKLKWDTPFAPTSSSVTTDTITLNAVEGCVYRIGDTGDWQNDTVFTGLAMGTQYTFYQMKKGDSNHLDSEISPAATITTGVPQYYDIKWVDGNGAVLKTDNLVYGATPSYSGATPTKTATAQYTYTFNNTWSPAVESVTGEATYTAQFNSTVNTYTVTWKNADETTLETDADVPYGATPSYDGETPTKEADDNYTYSFKGWLPEISAVTGDVTYTASYDRTEKPKVESGGKTVDTEKLKTDNANIDVQTGSVMDKLIATADNEITEDNVVEKIIDMLADEDKKEELIGQALSEEVGTLKVEVNSNTAQLTSNDTDIVSAVLTPQELVDVLAGKNIEVKLAIEEKDIDKVDSAVATKVEENLGENEEAIYFDVQMTKTVTEIDDNGDAEETVTEVKELGDDVGIRLSIPITLTDKTAAYRVVLSYKDESGDLKTEELADKDTVPDTYTVETNKTGSLALIYVRAADTALSGDPTTASSEDVAGNTNKPEKAAEVTDTGSKQEDKAALDSTKTKADTQLDSVSSELKKVVDTLDNITDTEKAGAKSKVDTAISSAKEAITKADSEEAVKKAVDAAADTAKKTVVDSITEDITKQADKAKTAIDSIAGLSDKEKTAYKAEMDKAASKAVGKAAEAVARIAANAATGAGDSGKAAASSEANVKLIEELNKEITADISDVKTEAKVKGVSNIYATPKLQKSNAIKINAGLKVDQTGKTIKIRWGKVADADGYKIYVQYCGRKFTKGATKTVKGAKTTGTSIKKLNGKSLNLKKNFKVSVVAYKNADGKKVGIGKSISAHVVGVRNKKYTNAKSVKITSHTIIDVYIDQPYQIAAKTVLVSKKKKQLSDSHAKEFRYASSDESIATVSDSGLIKGRKPGKVTIWVYARNGYGKKISVTVK